MFNWFCFSSPALQWISWDDVIYQQLYRRDREHDHKHSNHFPQFWAHVEDKEQRSNKAVYILVRAYHRTSNTNNYYTNKKHKYMCAIITILRCISHIFLRKHHHTDTSIRFISNVGNSKILGVIMKTSPFKMLNTSWVSSILKQYEKNMQNMHSIYIYIYITNAKIYIYIYIL